MKRFALTTSTLLSAALLAACSASKNEEPEPASAPATSTQSATPEQPLHYVALGDSYAAMGSESAPTTGPGPCVRSADNYPSVVLEDANIEGVDASCSGAQSRHIIHDWANGTNIPAQVNSLRPDTDLVSLSVGGNDADFGAISRCLYGKLSEDTGPSCESELGAVTDRELESLPAKLDAVYEEIARRSPDARIIATGYFTMLEPNVQCSESGAISHADRMWSINVTHRINDIVSDAASRHNAQYVLPADADEHTACVSPEERWVNILGDQTDSYPMHPTAAGQKAMGTAVLEAVNKG